MGSNAIENFEEMESVKYKIGTNRNPIFLSLKKWNGRKLLDVRKFFRDKEDESKYLPTKKGISLNETQLQQMIDVFNHNEEEISTFFGSSTEENHEISLNITNTMGRKFRFDFSNKRTELILDEELGSRLGSENLELVKLMLFNFQKALHSVLDEEDEIELILDSVSHNMSRTKW